MKKAFFCAAAIILVNCGVALAQAHETVLWSFGAQGDGEAPVGTMVFDNAGNLYGVTAGGGMAGCGTVFELTATAGIWTETVLHSFGGSDDGCMPLTGLISDIAGNLYGTTAIGGNAACPNGCGVVFELSQQSGVWAESILHTFVGIPDGQNPVGRLTLDQSGNLYGTTANGGAYSDQQDAIGGGTVFQLVPGLNGWTENILYSFNPQTTEGNSPEDGVIFDTNGDLYGAALRSGPDGHGFGLVYELSPTPAPPWTETVIRKFNGTDGNGPSSDLQIDDAGRLYGATGAGGTGFGVLFRLVPNVGTWTQQDFAFDGSNGNDPGDFLLSGNVAYGMTQAGGSPSCNDHGVIGCGVMYRTSGRTASVLHEFCQNGKPPTCPDGAYPGPAAGPITDGFGNLYGVTEQGGTYNQGVVFEITL